MSNVVLPWLAPDDPSGLASLERHVDVISHISPTWYSMGGDGTITGQSDSTIVALCRTHMISLQPLIRNDQFAADVAHGILGTADSRERAADEIANLVLREGFGGINLDFEGPFGASRAAFTDFVSRIASKLHTHGKWVTVDVVPQLKTADQYDTERSWSAPYDYAALGQICDAVMLMAYDYSTATPGPISPLWWLQRVVQFGASQIPPSKLIVGLPFYGRRWNVHDGQVSSSQSLTQAGAVALLSESGAEEQRPDSDATPRFSWDDASGTHVVHFEDAESMHAKLAAVVPMGVAGFAFWRLGQEEASQWDVIGAALKAIPRP